MKDHVPLLFRLVTEMLEHGIRSQECPLRANGEAILPFLPDQVGGAWMRKIQVDEVGSNSMEKTLILGECKWSPKAMNRDVLETQVQ